MGRRKAQPHRSGGILERQFAREGRLDNSNALKTRNVEFDIEDRPFCVEIDRNCWLSEEHHDISEVVLINLSLGERYSCFRLDEQLYQDPKYSLRLRLHRADEYISRDSLGHWPVMSSSSIFLELIEKYTLEGNEVQSVVLSGSFDGPDDGVSGLVHLASLKFLALRPVPGLIVLEGVYSLRARVEMLKNAFNACESLLDSARHLWKKSMMSVMVWLRPEVTTSEAKYGVNSPTDMEFDMCMEEAKNYSISAESQFDVAGFYEGIEPPKDHPVLENDVPGLLPKLRAYQRRAVCWMVHREKRSYGSSRATGRSWVFSPLCVPVNFIDTPSRMFYNPFSGNISLLPEYLSHYVSGGILADDMGLGKTIELLACVMAHKKPTSGCGIADASEVIWEEKSSLKRSKRERIECICGSVSESPKYKGLWVQCDICDAWQHASCVGYSPERKTSKSSETIFSGQRCRTGLLGKHQKNARKKCPPDVVVEEEEHICQLCMELIQVTNSPIVSSATLIVCPAPILSQWHAEIIHHTNPGFLKVCIYEGVRDSAALDMSLVKSGELINADIVLTTYNVLKRDLSYDSDRYEGDRRIMRFQKRYPVFPTLLTRIYWWRLCLDEAQMVESSAAAATEMALRLHAKHRWCITGTPIQRKLDDLYGLLRFLEAKPFDTLRWWIEVIRDPYQRGDLSAIKFTHKFFKEIMWRSSKFDVADELELPPQEESVSWLTFSPIEEHFYWKQHETCVNFAREFTESFIIDSHKDNTHGYASPNAISDPFITHLEAGKLLNSLLKLRQACCHPQVGSSGLRSLQRSPMPMEQILQVLVSKTKLEGEEALRSVVVVLNGLAGVAIIKQDLSQATSLYKEALALAEEQAGDFSLDPLLNIHIYHNLAEILPVSTNYPHQFSLKAEECPRKLLLSNYSSVGEYDAESMAPVITSSHRYLRMNCEQLKKNYLSTFKSKLSIAQQEFRRSYMQVCEAVRERKEQHSVWWLEILHQIEKNKNSSNELISKIGDAVSGGIKSNSLRTAFRIRSITSLKYHIQTGLDELEASRQMVIDRLMDINQMMENPRHEDVIRVRRCPNCQATGDGQICILCELDELFQVYEARLFSRKSERGEMITSVGEALSSQKRISALNHFYWSLSNPPKNSTSSTVKNEENKRKRDVREKLVVTKAPSELEVFLGIIKAYAKAQLGKEGISTANKQLLLLEGMRKEHTHAKSLAVAQAQLLHAHDEIIAATSRMRLRKNDDDKSIDALSLGELDGASADLSQKKMLSLTLLSRIRRQLRYLKGLALSKQKVQSDPNDSHFTQDTTAPLVSCTDENNGGIIKADEEDCPVCQEKLRSQKMVFQCGHIICCKCVFAMIERRLVACTKSEHNWIMCPTCRQHTDFHNIAYVDDGQYKQHDIDMPCTSQSSEKSESSIPVEGSYGTKIEAVTRRILWIKFMDPKAKVLVFSSWNDVLDVLECALSVNHITHIRMKGGRKSQIAISLFKGHKNSKDGTGKSPEPESDFQVLLLLIQHGANGLNLLEAQHVILVEPLLNPAAEAQAISRVHRIGQEKKTLVHRFIVKGTVEESIYRLNRRRNENSFISGNRKNRDQPVLTLKEIESLLAPVPSTGPPEHEEERSDSLRDLPPSVAAGLAAERRLKWQAP